MSLNCLQCFDFEFSSISLQGQHIFLNLAKFTNNLNLMCLICHEIHFLHLTTELIV